MRSQRVWLTVMAKGEMRFDYSVIVSWGELTSSKLPAPSYGDKVRGPYPLALSLIPNALA